VPLCGKQLKQQHIEQLSCCDVYVWDIKEFWVVPHTHLLSMFVSLNARSVVSALAKIPLVDKHCYHICIIDTGTWSLILLWVAPRIFTLHTISMLFTWMNTVSHIFMV
jgi:hypothetical protein